MGCGLGPVGPPLSGEEAFGCCPQEWERLRMNVL